MRGTSKVRSLDNQLENQFITVATNLHELLAKEGIKNAAYLEGTPYFSALDEQKKRAIIEHMELYYQLCAEHHAEGQALRDSQKFTWRALVKLGWVPSANLMDTIGSGDIVEIYSDEQVQLFRNLEFFDFCSYTLEELFCVEWYRLFARDESVSRDILKMLEEIYSKKHPEGLTMPLPYHIVVESLSRDRFSMDFCMKFIAPLYKNKQIVGVVCVEQAKLH